MLVIGQYILLALDKKQDQKANVPCAAIMVSFWVINLNKSIIFMSNNIGSYFFNELNNDWCLCL
jgi:hypothetical protein